MLNGFLVLRKAPKKPNTLFFLFFKGCLVDRIFSIEWLWRFSAMRVLG